MNVYRLYWSSADGCVTRELGVVFAENDTDAMALIPPHLDDSEYYTPDGRRWKGAFFSCEDVTNVEELSGLLRDLLGAGSDGLHFPEAMAVTLATRMLELRNDPEFTRTFTISTTPRV